MSKQTIANNKINVSGTTFKLPPIENIKIDTRLLSDILADKANTESPVFTGNVGIGTAAPRVALDIFSTGAILVPAGTTAQQPTGVKGLLRYNTSTDLFEGYSGTAWSQIGGSTTTGVSITSVTPSDSWIVTTNNGSGLLGVNVTLGDMSAFATKISLHSAYAISSSQFKIILVDYATKNKITISSGTYNTLIYNIVLTKNGVIVADGKYTFTSAGVAQEINTP